MNAIPSLDAVLRSAARLQGLVPDAVLVGGTAAAWYAGRRLSSDHDHVLADLRGRFDIVLDALGSDPEWVLNRAAPGKIILGSLGDIEAGVLQLIRSHPLEIERVSVGDATVVVPTAEETLRIKAYLLIKRNQTRDYFDCAALADRFGIEWAGATLASIDIYYDAGHDVDAVASQVARQLAVPSPADEATTRRLSAYKGLASRWHDWAAVEAVCRAVADEMVR